jgi:hypothetical protein
MGIIYTPATEGALHQGEIIANLEEPFVYTDSIVPDESAIPRLGVIKHDLCIVISQECDLDLEYRARISPVEVAGRVSAGTSIHDSDGTNSNNPIKNISNILFCDVFAAVKIRNVVESRALWGQIEINNQERYHYLRAIAPDEDVRGEGIDYLVVDFRRYFSLTVEEAYERVRHRAQRRSVLQPVYAAQLSSRFANYLSRVALPEDHKPRPATST